MKKLSTTTKTKRIFWLLFVCSLSIPVTVVALAGDCPKGDLNGDCKVNLLDLGVLADNWLEVEPNLPVGSVIVNEVMAHSHGGASDWIELYNTTGVTLDISGWYLSDTDSPLTNYKIPNGTTIAPYGYIVFYENSHFGTKFQLSENGDDVYLSFGLPAPDTTWYEICDDRKFGASETGVSLGLYTTSIGEVKFVAMDSNTPGSANAYPKVGPIVINEIMYDPVEGSNAEYVELHNIEDYPVTLQVYDVSEDVNVPWKFTEGPNYEFPLGTTIDANGYLIVARDTGVFDSTYGDVGVEVLGPFADGTKLNNDGENVEISMPGDLDPCDPGIRYYIRIDNVDYSDGSQHEDFVGLDPWPDEPDVDGESLNRIDPNLYGDDVANWETGGANPGE